MEACKRPTAPLQGALCCNSQVPAIAITVTKPHLDVRLLRRGLGQLKHLKGSLQGDTEWHRVSAVLKPQGVSPSPLPFLFQLCLVAYIVH